MTHFFFALIFKTIFATENFLIACGGVFANWEILPAKPGGNRARFAAPTIELGRGFKLQKVRIGKKAVTFSVPRNANQGHFVSRSQRQRPFWFGAGIASEQRADLRRENELAKNFISRRQGTNRQKISPESNFVKHNKFNKHISLKRIST